MHKPSDLKSVIAAVDEKENTFKRIDDDIGVNFLGPFVGKGEISFLKKHGILHSLKKQRAQY